MLSFANITFTSALSYQSSVGVGFTFNPTLSVNISPSDLVIPNLTPDTIADSNNITVSVATNATYGYTLSVVMNGNNNDLAHTNGTDVFSSIATNSSLSSLTTNNTWGYSYKLSNDTNWNNYSGLSNETSKTLVDSNDQTAIPIDFKIGAKAASTQASGTYTGTINFTAVTKHIPVTLAEAYASEGKTMINGYYTMQDMTSTICNKTEAIGAQLQVLDIRDNKLYWIAKLADHKCWMTQNLDLDLDNNRTYTHWDTDLGWSTENGNNIDENDTWRPIRSTIDFTIGSAITGWQSSDTEPYPANPGEVYFYTSNSDTNDIQYNSLQECVNAGHNDCTHYHAGNYYNWSATLASNNTSNLTNGNVLDSICPSGWSIPNYSNNTFNTLTSFYNISTNTSLNLRNTPLYYSRPGLIENGLLLAQMRDGAYRTNGAYNEDKAYYLLFSIGYFNTKLANSKHRGISIRCLAR